MSQLEELQAAKKEIADLQNEVAKKIKKVFHESVRELFTANPTLTSISFRAYTPYFNDGDSCVYRSGHTYPDLNGVDEYDEESEDYAAACAAWEALGETETTRLKKVVKDFMKHWDNTDMMNLFGDHVKVTITAKGIETEEYEHE